MDNILANNKPRVKKRKTKTYRDKLMKRAKLNITINNEKSTAKIVKLEKKNKKNISNLDCKNITNDRITIKHGIFAKGTRSETVSRSGLTEEYKARSSENLNQIIDLANGKPMCGNITGNVDMLDKFKVKKNASSKPNNRLLTIESAREEPMIEIKRSLNDEINNSTLAVGQIKSINLPSARRSTGEVMVINAELIPSMNKSSKILRNKYTADYGEIYTKLTDNIPNITKNFLPKDENATETIRNCLMEVFKTKCKKQMIDNSGKQSISRYSAETSIFNDKKPLDNLVLLNPLLYLKQFHKTENSKDTSDFKDVIQTKPYIENSPEICYIQNTASRTTIPNKYIESLSNFTAICSNAEGLNSGKIKEGNRRKHNATRIENVDSDISDDYCSGFSPGHSQISLYITDATPEQVYYPRRMNFNK